MERQIQEFYHSSIGVDTKKILNDCNIVVRCKLDEIVAESGLTQKEFGEKYGIRSATISELINLKKKNINIMHIALLMHQLGITDIREIIDIEIR